MNGKTVKKLLMKSRHRVFWGKRAYLTVRLPVSLITEKAPPEVEFPGFKPSYFLGYWENEDKTEYIVISKYMTGADPRLGTREDYVPVYFPCLEYKNESYESWSFWSGFHAKRTEAGIDHVALAEDVVAKYKAGYEWNEALHKYGVHPVVDLFLEAGEQAKSVHWSFNAREQLLYCTYGVKWFYPERKLGFSSALAKAMKNAKRAGVPVRVLRER